MNATTKLSLTGLSVALFLSGSVVLAHGCCRDEAFEFGRPGRRGGFERHGRFDRRPQLERGRDFHNARMDERGARCELAGRTMVSPATRGNRGTTTVTTVTTVTTTTTTTTRGRNSGLNAMYNGVGNYGTVNPMYGSSYGTRPAMTAANYANGYYVGGSTNYGRTGTATAYGVMESGRTGRRY